MCAGQAADTEEEAMGHPGSLMKPLAHEIYHVSLHVIAY
jgi:hypothetical protein